jgi:heptosyltransferase-2
MSQASYYQHLTSALGIPAGALDARVAVPGEALNGAADLLRQAGRDEARPFVVLAPGAAYGTAKRWPPAHFARLAADLVSQLGVQCVIVGTGADAATSAEILAAVPAVHRREVIDLCGRTDLERLAGVLALARACVSNDSGAMHLAAAAGVPLAALFGPTNERETAPVPRPGTPAHVLIHHVACRPCMLRDCPIDHPCMRNLAPDRVFGTVAGMLGDEREREARG